MIDRVECKGVPILGQAEGEARVPLAARGAAAGAPRRGGQAAISGPAPRLLVLALTLLVGALVGCGPELHDPVIRAVVPVRGGPGAAVDLIGERFDGERRGVSFGGVQARVLLWEPGRARVEVPQGPQGHTVVVITVEGRPSAPADFFVE